MKLNLADFDVIFLQIMVTSFQKPSQGSVIQNHTIFSYKIQRELGNPIFL